MRGGRRDTNARRAILNRAAWAVLDQGIYTSTNLALTVIIARYVSAREFGAYAVVYGIVILALALNRGLICEPFAARSARIAGDLGDTIGPPIGAAILIGLLLGTSLVIVAVAVGDHQLGEALLWFGMVAPIIVAQDAWRYALVALGRPTLSTAIDTIWAAAQLVLFVGVIWSGEAALGSLILAWGGAATASVFGAAFLSRTVPAPYRGLRSVLDDWRLSLTYSADALMVAGALQVVLWFLAATAGLTAAGSLRAAQVLFGPLALVVGGLRMAAVPEASRLLWSSPQRLRPYTLAVSAALLLITAAWSTMLLLLPESLGKGILGGSWTGASALVPWISIERIAVGLMLGAVVGLRAITDRRSTLIARTCTSVMVICFGIIGALLRDAPGAAVGVAVAMVIGSSIWWVLFHLKERGINTHMPER